jgi:hypothetical protein
MIEGDRPIAPIDGDCRAIAQTVGGYRAIAPIDGGYRAIAETAPE